MLTPHNWPTWLTDLKRDFSVLVVNQCSGRVRRAVEKNEKIQVWILILMTNSGVTNTYQPWQTHEPVTVSHFVQIYLKLKMFLFRSPRTTELWRMRSSTIFSPIWSKFLPFTSCQVSITICHDNKNPHAITLTFFRSQGNARDCLHHELHLPCHVPVHWR